MRLHYYCGCYKTTTPLIDKPEECDGEGLIEVHNQDWIDGVVSFNCWKCGALLTMEMDHFNLN